MALDRPAEVRKYSHTARPFLLAIALLSLCFGRRVSTDRVRPSPAALLREASPCASPDMMRAPVSGATAARELRAVRRAQELLAETGGRAPDWGGVAAASGVPEGTLSRAFRRALGCTPAEHLRRVRVEAAARALAAGDAPLGRVALDAGYYDQAHFSRAFKARFGVTPSAYRKLVRA
jgi:AraC-like DNA-binding protein